MNMLSSPVCLYALAMAGFILVAGTARNSDGYAVFAEWLTLLQYIDRTLEGVVLYIVSFL